MWACMYHIVSHNKLKYRFKKKSQSNHFSHNDFNCLPINFCQEGLKNTLLNSNACHLLVLHVVCKIEHSALPTKNLAL